MISQQSIQIWPLSADKREFDRYKSLLDGRLANSLDSEALNASLLAQAQPAIKGTPSLIVVHDICEIRKKYSQELAELSQVRDLEGELVNGYRTFDSIAIDAQTKQLHLLACHPAKAEEDLNQAGLRQLIRLHEGLKQAQPELVICHLLDRWFDDVTYFEEIDALSDSYFVIRMKKNRNSDVATLGPTGQERWVKWADKELVNSFTQTYEKFAWADNVYHQVQAHLSYEPLYLKDRKYYLVKVDLRTRKGQKVFKGPMLMITNYVVHQSVMAQWVFQRYLNRSKIEAAAARGCLNS
jgi:hypothetical protein